MVANKAVFPLFEMQKVVVDTDNAGVAKLTELLTLPIGAEIFEVSVEVTTAFVASTTIDLGLTSSANKFLNDQSLAAAGNFKSTVQTALVKPENMTVTFNQASATGSASIRVAYFLPSTEIRDY